jgi:hypothetical protein
MLVRVLSAAVNGIEAFPVEVEVNCGWGDTIVVMIGSFSPIATTRASPAGKPASLLTPAGLKGEGNCNISLDAKPEAWHYVKVKGVKP